MSEPVTNVEIEDVLSSIRRLVTEDGRVERRTKSETPTSGSGRLVLTPALRVASADESSQPHDEDRPPEPAHEPARAFHPSAEPDEIKFRSRKSMQAAPQAPAADDSSTETSPAPWTEPGATLHQAASEATEPVAEPSVPGGDRPDMSAGSQPPETPAKAAEETGLPDASDAPVADAASPDDAALAEASLADTLSAKIQALETAIAQAPDQQWEPDGSGEEDNFAGAAFKTMRWRDHADPKARPHQPGREPETVDATYESEEAAFEPEPAIPDEAVMDEEALRELVRDIVRQELRGALGERITRNVRKLVRREIHRAMTAQDLE